MTEPANADQIKFWNGPGGQKWAAHQSDMDRNLADVTAALLPFAAAKPGERVLDIGCGAGQTTFLLADAVGRTGHVTGVDISAPLLGAARSRMNADRNIAFVEADAAACLFRPEYDLVFSRFGVMFFDDPPAAFANIHKALKPGGRLAFACWRPALENAWVTVPALAARPFLPATPPPDPLAPGPFAFADPGRVEEILTKAGFSGVEVNKLDGVMNLGASADEAAFQMTNLGPLSRALGEVEDEAVRERVRAAVQTALEEIRKDGAIKPAIACWLVGATA
jgi:SAM-dependent methyltransferase